MLLDECLPDALRNHVPDAVTVAYAGLAGYKNGALLKAAIEAGFDVLLTGDKTLEYEQNFSGQNIALVCLSANAWPLIKGHVAKIAAAVDCATPGSLIWLECGVFSRRDAKPEPPSLG